MAFGNPYEEPWGPEIVQDTLDWLKDIRVRTVSLADTVGTATPELVRDLYAQVKDHVAGIELGVHLHSRPNNAEAKILAAYQAGCRRFDSGTDWPGRLPVCGGRSGREYSHGERPGGPGRGGASRIRWR